MGVLRSPRATRFHRGELREAVHVFNLLMGLLHISYWSLIYMYVAVLKNILVELMEDQWWWQC